MMCDAANAAMEPEPVNFDKGLIFVKDNDILLSGDRWTIVVNIALSDYDILIENMKLILNTVREKIEVHKNPKLYSFDIHWEEINRLEGMVRRLEMDLMGFKRLLFKETEGTLVRNPRGGDVPDKRGLINVLGYGLKYLFGTADAKDVQRLTEVCDDLHAFKLKMVHAVEQQLTYIHALDEMTKQNVKNTIELTRALRDSIRNISLQLNRVEADLLDTQVAMEKQVRYSVAIREIEMAILDLRFSITQLHESLDVTSNGKLSSVLINPYNLSEILQQVSLQLPAGLSMLAGLTVEDMYVYYTIATVHAVATSASIRLFVEIPLKVADRYFELYQVHSLPLFYERIGKFVMIDEEFTYLAVAESRQFFALIPTHMLAKCTQDLYTVCPVDMMIKTAGEPNCLTALFLGKTDIALTKCKRLIISEPFEPVWIRSPDYSYWIYSLSSPQRITVQCQEIGSPTYERKNQQFVLQGTGILPNSSSCYIHSENFKLLPHSMGRTTINLADAHIVLPNIDKILNIAEEDLFQTDVHSQTVNLQRLDDLIEGADSRSSTYGLNAAKMFTTLRKEEATQHTTSWVWPFVLGMISIGCGALWPIWFTLVKRCCPWIGNFGTCNLRSHRVAVTRKLNGNEIVLQNLAPGEGGVIEETMSKASSRDDPETQSTHRVR